MKTLRLNRSVLLPLAIGCLVFNHNPRAWSGPLKAGEAFPEIAQFQLEGKLPDQLRGKVVLVDFWASWCGPCKGSFPILEDLHKTYGDKGLVVLGVNLDETRKAMDDFLSKHKVTFNIVRDQHQKMVKTVSINTMPTSLLIDHEGKVRFIHNGFHGAATEKQYRKEIEDLLKAIAK